jgi:hypothetical protein
LNIGLIARALTESPLQYDLRYFPTLDSTNTYAMGLPPGEAHEGLVIITGGIDLSVGSIIGACSVIAALIPTEFGVNFWWGIFAALIFASSGNASTASAFTRRSISRKVL